MPRPTPPRNTFACFVREQLEDIEDVDCRRMFGGHGLYLGEVFFGILHADRLYLKTSEATRGEFIERGMGPFRPSPRQTLRTYFEVPLEILEDRQELAIWARRAAACASTGSKRRRSKRRSKRRS